MLSYQLSMPVATGTSRYENRGADWWRCLRVICNPYTTPGFPPRIGVRGMLSIAGMTNWGAILREPPIFVPIAHAGCRRHTKV